MAEADLLVDVESEIDENNGYLNFYRANLHFLKQDPLDQIPYYLKREIAANFYGTAEDKDDWIGALEMLSVDKTTIYDIDFKSKAIGTLPIILAINGVLKSKNTSLGDFIDILCKIGKFHILRLLKPFAEDLLAKRYSLNEEECYSGPLPTAPNYSSLEVTNSLVDLCESEVNYSDALDTGYSSIPCQETKGQEIKDHKTASDHFQNSEAASSNNHNNKQLYAVSTSQNIMKSVTGLISVFIMHSMLDKKYAKKLAACLKEKNFQAITSANIYHFLRDNPSQIMKAVDERADFIIPVVSESFIKQIKFTRYNGTEDKDIESIANTFLYDRLLNEYSLNNFFNHRVRPVCYSLEIRKQHKLDQILSWSAYLPYTDLMNDEELESKLLSHLRSSKKRLALSK